jgi:hypothetical protein
MSRLPTNVGTLAVYAGDTFTQTFIFKDGANVYDFVDAGWSDWVAQYRVTRDSDAAIDFAVDDSEADEGKITISLTATQTDELNRAGVFDLQASENGVVRTWLQGQIAWTRDVTRV